MVDMPKDWHYGVKVRFYCIIRMIQSSLSINYRRRICSYNEVPLNFLQSFFTRSVSISLAIIHG